MCHYYPYQVSCSVYPSPLPMSHHVYIVHTIFTCWFDLSVLIMVCSLLCHCDPTVCHLFCHPTQTQWHSIMNSSEHNKLMVTIHYCLGRAVWNQCREDYVLTAMSHFRTITTRYSSVIFVPAYYHLGMANAALHQ